MSADLKVVELNAPDMRDVPGGLRQLAEHIEEGKFGPVTSCVVVVRGSELRIVRMGQVDATDVYYMLGCAQRKIEAPMLEEGVLQK